MPAPRSVPDLENRAPTPPLDPECAAALAALPPRASWSTMSEMVAVLRASTDQDPDDEALTMNGAFTVGEHTFREAETDAQIALLVCCPVQPSPPRPTIYYIHGGGMFTGTNRSGLLEVLHLGTALDAVVVSVEYRLAPEHPDPIPVQDCYAGLQEMFDRADHFNIDARRVVVAGASAGGGLAAGVSLLSRDYHAPSIAGLLLMSPMLDDRNDSFSSYQMADIDTWDRRDNELAWAALLGDRRGGPNVPIYSSPARADDLAGMPATFLDVGSAETFRDEVVAFAKLLWQAGGAAELHVWPGGYHGYEFSAPQSRLAQLTWEARLGWLQRALDI